MTIRAIYENGVFRPTEPVNLPEHAEVTLEVTVIRPATPLTPEEEEKLRHEMFEILGRRYDTGQTDTAARHNEHQP